MQIEFPSYEFQWRESAGVRMIRDPLRRRYVAITPEEWVRQHLLRYMLETCGYPASRMSVEKKLTLNGMTRRADAVVYDREVHPWMVLECKAPEIALNQAVLDQAAGYNTVLKAPYLAVCNGTELLLAQVDVLNGQRRFLQHWPNWPEAPSW
ncbi:MAG: restriction endonuclease subunit R [Bacteroidetes bacterium]|nr:restriction endonuclease subunit R [Bacteroidota bacterium]